MSDFFTTTHSTVGLAYPEAVTLAVLIGTQVRLRDPKEREAPTQQDGDAFLCTLVIPLLSDRGADIGGI